MFHHFYNDEHIAGGQGALSADEFEEMLNYIGIERILSPVEWVSKLRANMLSKDDLCITFDDGLKSQFDVCYPVLDRYGLKCFWFIYSSVHHGVLEKFEIYRCLRMKFFDTVDDFFDLFFKKCKEFKSIVFDPHSFDDYYQAKIGLYPFYSVSDLKYRFYRDEVIDDDTFIVIMGQIIDDLGITLADLSHNLWLQDKHLKLLSDEGHYIGLHTYNHPTALAKMSYNAQSEQYNKNLAHIRDVCGTRSVSMAHPNNSYNRDTIRILKDLNIACGFRSNMEVIEAGTAIDPFLEVPRMDHAKVVKMMRE